LTGLGKIINPRSALPVLQSLRIERTPDGWVCLTATDLERFATLRLEQPAKGEPFALLAPFEELCRLAKSRGKDERLELEPPQSSPRHKASRVASMCAPRCSKLLPAAAAMPLGPRSWARSWT